MPREVEAFVLPCAIYLRQSRAERCTLCGAQAKNHRWTFLLRYLVYIYSIFIWRYYISGFRTHFSLAHTKCDLFESFDFALPSMPLYYKYGDCNFARQRIEFFAVHELSGIPAIILKCSATRRLCLVTSFWGAFCQVGSHEDVFPASTAALRVTLMTLGNKLQWKLYSCGFYAGVISLRYA